jgi:hypothetical protein
MPKRFFPSGLKTDFFAWQLVMLLKMMSRHRGIMPQFCEYPVIVKVFPLPVTPCVKEQTVFAID